MKNNIYTKLIPFIILIAIGYSNLLKASSPIVFQNEEELLDISSSILIYEDKTGLLTINDIQSKKFISTSQTVKNLGVSKSIFWIKLDIKNLSNQEELLLELSLPTIDNITFFHLKPNGLYESYKAGQSLDFNLRKYKEPNFLFDLYLPKDVNQLYYLKISSSGGIQIPMKIGKKTIFDSQIKIKDILSGVFLGIMLLAIFYNLFIFFSVRDNSYLYYVFYILLVLLTQMSFQGYTFQYLWPSSINIAKLSTFLFPSLVGIAGMEFMKVFLKIKNYNTKLYNISYFFTLIYFFSISCAFLEFYRISLKILEINALFVSLYMLIAPILILKKGYQPAKYFLVAWVIFLVGVIIYILKDFEILPFNNFTRYTMQIGSAIETILLSFALAARINIYKKEKEESQQKTVEVLQENEKIIKDQNIILEQKVKERTNELNNTLNHLKETQSQLIDAEKMSSLGQLTAGIAHEINNPINFVSSNIPPLKEDLKDLYSIIKKYEEMDEKTDVSKFLSEINALKEKIDYDYLSEELITIIDGIEDGAKRTAEIVSGLRNFSRLNEEELKPIDINEGIRSTLLLIKHKLDGITVNQSLGELPLCECNPAKINQLIMNLIDNAIYAIHEKKIPSKEGVIKITTKNTNDAILLTIEDNGVGIPKDIENKLFEPFFTTKDVGEGTGLGLSIVKGIIDSHDAKLTIDSEENIGTKIMIEIPLKQKENGQD